MYASENGRPSGPAIDAPLTVDPSTQIGTWAPAETDDRIGALCAVPVSPNHPCRSKMLRAKACGSAEDRLNAWAVIMSVPGARPRPRSMRSPWMAAKVPYCSATMSGAWLGSIRSEEHTSELQSLMRISYAVFCLKKKKHTINY